MDLDYSSLIDTLQKAFASYVLHLLFIFSINSIDCDDFCKKNSHHRFENNGSKPII
jgi:hypothetical protein